MVRRRLVRLGIDSTNVLDQFQRMRMHVSLVRRTRARNIVSSFLVLWNLCQTRSSKFQYEGHEPRSDDYSGEFHVLLESMRVLLFLPESYIIPRRSSELSLSRILFVVGNVSNRQNKQVTKDPANSRRKILQICLIYFPDFDK
ncbi:uncharacterized protein LOC129981343 isoform X1 [Argiope bruennichi]|uniref:uncharacterized protein LOC129981343 isoform X1 n=1 Tax=Argiope bruennichi TaxID=94029 RepID=UPI00249596B2|nr:uncharacterized protein LOC129981343 isoform X1 [Argiope bruennichi]